MKITQASSHHREMKPMKSKTYSDYVSYDLETYFSREPGGPVKCLICAGDLSKSAVEPSRAMRKEIASPDFHLRNGTTGSWLFTCKACHWWCIREGYEFVTGDWVYKYGHDYLIVCTAQNSRTPALKDKPVQDIHPWLSALDDPKVYSKIRTRKLPEELAVIFEGGMTQEQDRQRAGKK